MEEPKQEAAAPAMLKKKEEETEERELLSFAREMGRGMDSSRIGERDNVPHVLNYPFYSLLPRPPPRPPPLPSPPVYSRSHALPSPATSTPRRVGAMSETLNKACPLQFRVSPPSEWGKTPQRRRPSHKKQHCSIFWLKFALECSSPSRQIAKGDQNILRHPTCCPRGLAPSELLPGGKQKPTWTLDSADPRPTCPAHPLCTQMRNPRRTR